MNRSQGNLIYLDLWNFKYNQVLRYLSLVNLVQEFIQSPSEFSTISDLYIKVRYDQKRIGAETWKVRTFKSLLFRWFPSFRLWHFIEKLFCMGIFPYGRKGKSDAFKLFTSAGKAYDYYKNALDSCNVFQTALNKRPSKFAAERSSESRISPDMACPKFPDRRLVVKFPCLPGRIVKFGAGRIVFSLFCYTFAVSNRNCRTFNPLRGAMNQLSPFFGYYFYFYFTKSGLGSRCL